MTEKIMDWSMFYLGVAIGYKMGCQECLTAEVKYKRGKYKKHKDNITDFKNKDQRREYNRQYFRTKISGKKSDSLRCKKYRDNLPDAYISQIISRRGMEVSQELIEITRIRIIMKRTLKEFEQWRKEKEK